MNTFYSFFDILFLSSKKITASLLFLFFLAFSSHAQTTLISPTGDGGFENGATFAANGWTVANGATNQWFVGSVATSSAGSNSAYVSDNASGTTHNYLVSSASTVHFYRDVTFPAGEPNIVLSFKWKGQGESSYDYVTVYSMPTTLTPTYNSPAGGYQSWLNISTAYSGSTVHCTPQNLNLQSAYQTQTICLPSSYAGTSRRLVFMWSNDVSGGTQTPGSIDEISLVSSATPSAPANQPTSLSLTAVSSSQINGSFTAASGATDAYLVVRYPTGATATNPTNGVTYSVGGALGAGKVMSSSAATTFSATTLAVSTTYDFYIYAFNTAPCASGPLYKTTAPLFGTQTTQACGGLSGTYSVGPTGAYATLTAAVAAVSAGLTSSVVFELQSSYTSSSETFPITFPFNGCASASKTITIRPQTGATALLITSTNATATIDLNGANNVIIDGRPGGSGTTSQLTISNTATGSSCDIRFINDATNNTITYCTLLGSTSTSFGVVLFSTGVATGNDGNTLSSNLISAAGSNFPLNGIYSLGSSTTVDNSSNTITSNSISDYFSAASATNGMNINSNNSGWTITNNKLFQTATRVYTTANTHNGIFISSGFGYTITGNTIGYANASGTGTTNIVGNTVSLTGTFPSSYTVTGTANATRYNAINCAFTAGGAVSSIQNNTVAGFALYTSSGATTTFGILCGIAVTSGNVNIGTTTGNTIGATTGNGSIYTVCTTTGGIVVGIYVTSGNNVNIQNNTIGAIDAMGSTATISGGINGINSAGAGNYKILNNTIGNSTSANLRMGNLNTGANLSNAGTTFGIASGSTTFNGIINSASGIDTLGTVALPNVIQNVSLNSSSTSSKYIGIATSSGTYFMQGNTIQNITAVVTNTSISSGVLAGTGIYASGGTAGSIITQNTISNLALASTTTSGTNLGGISVANTAIDITRNKIYDLRNASTSTTAATPGTASGIVIRSATAGVKLNIINNMISVGNGQTTNTCFMGIWGNHGSAPDPIDVIYFNTINIEGTVSSGAICSFGFERGSLSTTATGSATVDIRNNIINNSRSGGTGKHYAIANMFNATTTTATGWGTNASNYNILNGGASTTVGFWTSDQSISGWQTAAASDASSLSGVTTSFTSTSTGDLHITNIPSAVESAGTPISTVTVDFDNQTRSSYSPTDIGADANNFFNYPVISYTPFLNSCAAGVRTLVANIVDADGVATSGSALPVLYWRINAGSYTASTASSLGGNQYQFSLGTGSAIGDSISYYIVAQDGASNVGSYPSLGAAGFSSSPPAASTPPTSPSIYKILSTLTGTYTVGSGGSFTTLTDAVNAYNTKCISGSVVFNLTDASYPSETFPIIINSNVSASATNTLLIKPATGITPSFSGTVAAALISFNGASYVTIDGSNSGGTDRSLTITNTNTVTPTAISLVSMGVGFGASNITIKNCNISTGSSTSIGYGIALGGSSPGSSGADNDNNTIQNNAISNVTIGIYAYGTAAVSSGGMDNLNVSGNSVTTNTTIATIGIQLGNGLNSLVQGNNLNIFTSASSQPVGISLETGFVSSSIKNNLLTQVNTSSTGGYGSRGITIGTGILTSNLLISNNTIYGVNGSNYSSFTNSSSMGIGIGMVGGSATLTTTTGGVKLYHNTVNMAGTYSYSSSCLTAALYVGSAAASLEILNNIFVNSLNNTNASGTTSKNYAVYSVAPNTAFTNLNYNDYYVSGTQGVLGFLGADVITLSAFQTAFGSNAASINFGPTFVSATDLHMNSLSNWCLNGSGIPVSEVTTDYDNDTRNATNPDMGSDEFSVTGFVITNPSQVCPGSTFDLTAAAVTAGSQSGLTFTYWNDAAATSAITTPSALSAAGTFYIKALDALGCTLVLPVSVSFYTPPVAPSATTPVAACSGIIANALTATALSGHTLLWYTVSSGGTGSSTPIVPSTATAGSTSYYVSQVSPLGCEGARTTIVVNVNQTPGVPSVTTPVTYCQNATASALSATAAAGNSLNWYTVSVGGTPSSTAITPSTTTAGTFDYYVSQTSPLSCEGPRNTIQVIINPATAITSQPASVSQCAGTTATFNVSAIGTGTLSYQWYKNGSVIASATSSSFSQANISFSDSGAYTVVVSSSCGPNITSNVAKLVIASVVPTITPASALVCPGSSLILQASPVGANVVGYQWTLNGFDITGATSSFLVVSSTSLGTYAVTANYVGGCSNVSANTTVALAPKPTAAFTVNSAVQCINGNSFTFTNGSSVSGTLTYAWSFGDGTFSTATSPVKTYAAFGAYTVKLVITSNNGCIDSTSKMVSINPKPTPSFTINSASQCLGSNNFVFTNTSSVVSGSVTYLWNFGDGTTSTSTSPSKTYSTSNTFAVKLVVTSSFGCVDSTTQNVTVNANPTPATPTGAVTVCSTINSLTASTVSYTSTLISGLNYSWTVVGGTISGSASGLNLNTVSVLWGAAGTGSVTVTVTNTTTTCSGSATLSGININPSPTAIIAGVTTACLNSTNYYSLSNTSGGTIIASGYSWTVVGGSITSGQGTSGIIILWTSTGAKTINCTLTNTQGCTGKTPTLNVTILANPVGTFSGTTTVCVNTPYVYTATTTVDKYVWVPTGGTISSQSANTVTIVWSNIATASLQLYDTASTGCGGTSVKAITVTGPLSASISGATQACMNSTQTFTLNGATSTLWNVTGGTITASTASTATILWNTLGSQTLTATYANGLCSYSVTYSINVNALPTPVITGPNSVCTGTKATYSTTNSGGRLFNWNFTGGGTIVSGQGTNVISILWTSAGGTSVNVNETIISSGCSVTSGAIIGIVNETPSSTITGSSNVCSGDLFTYTASAATNYTWSITGGTITGATNTSSVDVIWGTGVSGTLQLLSSNASCSTTTTLAVNINITPTPVITGGSSMCSGTSLNTYSTAFKSNYTYLWTVINGTYTYGGNNSVINITPNSGASSVTILLTATVDGSSCFGNTSKVVNVNTTPAVSITGNTSACQNSSQVYTGVGASTYTFSVSGGVITSTTATTATITWGSGTGMVSVIGTSAAGCSSSSTLPVTINALPSSVITGLSQACANNSGSYSVTSQIGASYLWTATGGTISGGSTNNTVTVNWGASGAGTINVTVTSSLGCVSTRTMNININTQPTPSISGSATVCQNTNQSYSITAIAGAAYNWSVVGGTITTGAGTNSVSVNWTIAGAGQLSVSQSTGSCMASSSISVTVNAAPAIPTVYKVGNVLSTTTVATSYQWYNGAAAVGTGTTYTATAAGIYTLVVTNAAGCTTSSSGVLANVGIKSSRSLSNVTVYPNPTKDMIMISATLNKSQSVTVKIFDVNGKLVFNTSQNNADANYSKTISLAGYASGVYMVQVITNDGSVQQRIVKE